MLFCAGCATRLGYVDPNTPHDFPFGTGQGACEECGVGSRMSPVTVLDVGRSEPRFTPQAPARADRFFANMAALENMAMRKTTDVMKDTAHATTPPAEGEALTRLTQKHHSPLTIRKFTKHGFPVYVGLITDDNLDTLDHIVMSFLKVKENKAKWKSDSIQDKRDLAGMLTEHLCEAFERTEGAAVVLYVDKTCISSLHGDFMNHAMCRSEFYTLLLMGTAV